MIVAMRLRDASTHLTFVTITMLVRMTLAISARPSVVLLPSFVTTTTSVPTILALLESAHTP